MLHFLTSKSVHSLLLITLIFLTLLLIVSVHPLTYLHLFSTYIFFHSFFLLFFRLFFQPIWYHFFSYRFLRCTAFLLRLSPFLILTVSSFANAIASATVPTFYVPNVQQSSPHTFSQVSYLSVA